MIEDHISSFPLSFLSFLLSLLFSAPLSEFTRQIFPNKQKLMHSTYTEMIIWPEKHITGKFLFTAI